MSDSDNTMTSAWQVSLDSSRLRLESPEMTAFFFDIDNDGNNELCIQDGRQFIVEKEGKVIVESESIVVPVRNTDQGIQYVEAKDNGVSLIRDGVVVKTQGISSRRFGLCFLTKELGSLKLVRKVGYYKEKCKITAIAVDPTDDGDINRIYALTESGLMFVFDGQLKIVSRIRVHNGEIELAEIFIDKTTDPDDPLIGISVYSNTRIKKLFFEDLDYTWWSYLICRNALTDKRKRVRVASFITNKPGWIITKDCEQFDCSTGKFNESKMDDEYELHLSMNDESIVSNPFGGAGTHVVNINDGTEKQFSVSSVAGGELWEQAVPESDTRSCSVQLTRGPENMKGGFHTGLYAKTEHVIPEYNTKVAKEHLRIYNERGEIVCSYDFPENGEYLSTDSDILLHDNEGSGIIEMLIINNDSIRAFRQDNEQNIETASALKKGLPANLPEFALPDENLWDVKVVNL